MDLPGDWQARVISWAEQNGSVLELWLFGSRATGRARPDSDVDLAIVLMPPTGRHDWAFGNYVSDGDDWQAQLAEIIGRHVSLEAIRPGTRAGQQVMAAGVLMFRRSE